MKRKPILKQIADLTPGDFAKSAVWVYVHAIDYDEPWHDDCDEETVRPWTAKVPVEPDDAIFLVRATLTLADGRVFEGYLTPQAGSKPADLGTVQPSLFLPSGERVDFWDGMFKRDAKDRKGFYKELGKDIKAIFPITFSADKKLSKGRINGEIPGFCWQPKDTIKVYH